MHIKFTDIDNALEYYGINDNNYRNKCYKCIEDMNNIEDFNKQSERVYNILYNDKSVEINKLWKKQNIVELFGEKYNPFVTSILILLGYKLHKINMESRNYDNLQKELHKKRVQETLTNDIYIKNLESVRISQMIWATYFINAKLIEVGRLQYEKCKNYIKIHIPSGEKLELEKVLKSLKESQKEIEKYFDIRNPQYRCESWLLSNQINAIIDTNSNIAKFYRLFDVEDGSDATKDILNFVFEVQECNDYNNLKDNTTLQRILKQQLLDNKVFKIGWGKLKNEL